MRLCLGIGVVFAMAGTAVAQTPEQMRLPGDLPPPPMADMLRPPRAPGERPPEPIYTAPASPDLDAALRGARAALDACTAQGLKVGVVVTDAAGNIRVGLADAAARPGRIYTAARKALAAASFAMPTSQLQEKLRADESLRATVAQYGGLSRRRADPAQGSTGRRDGGERWHRAAGRTMRAGRDRRDAGPWRVAASSVGNCCTPASARARCSYLERCARKRWFRTPRWNACSRPTGCCARCAGVGWWC